MKELILTLQQNPYFSLCMSIITIISIIYAVYTNTTTKKYRFIEHCELSKTLLFPGETSNNDLHLYYKNEEISNATITNIAIWNAGNEAIRSTDLASALCLYFDDKNDNEDDDLVFVNSILDASILGCTNKKSQVKITEHSENRVWFDFKFLNRDDGFVVQLLHTGYPFNLRVDADVIGENKRKLRLIYKRKHRIQSAYYDYLRELSKKGSIGLCTFVTVTFVCWILAKAFYPSLLGNNQLDIKVTTIMLVALLIVSWTSLFFIRKADIYDYVPSDIKELLKR